MKTIKNLTILSIITVMVLSSCSKEDPKKPVDTNPQEVLTTVLIKGYDHDNPNNTARQFSFKWEDLDGDAGKEPVIDTMVLDSGIEYHCQIIMLDKTKTPFDTVSVEIEKEKNAHQFFYTPSANLLGKFSTEILDLDDNKLPVGLEFHLLTKSNQSYALPIVGSMNVVLSHYDGIVKTTSKSDESDIDLQWPIKIK